MGNITFKDYYEILNINHSCPQEQIKEAYIAKAKFYHHDINKAPNSNEKMKEINEAYEILKNNSLKNLYDKEYYLHKVTINNTKTQVSEFIVNADLSKEIYETREKYDILYGKAKTELINITAHVATESLDAFKAGLWMLGIFGVLALIVMAFSK